MNTKNATQAHVSRVQMAVGQRDALHQVGDQVAAEAELADGEDRAEQPVEHGRLPHDEGLVLQQKRRAAEDDDDHQRQPVDDAGAPVLPVNPAICTTEATIATPVAKKMPCQR